MSFSRSEYPSPQFKRENWQTLNGTWEFCFDDAENGISKKLYESGKPLGMNINVPFAYQCKASGIGISDLHEVMWYRRTFRLSEEMKGGKTLLHFNGVDYEAEIWLNGKYVGSHVGGYTHFSFDVTEYLAEENTIAIRVTDRYDCAQPRGKQYWKKEPSRCWYVASSGIWQSVWLEKTGCGYIERALFTPDIDTNSVLLETESAGKFDALKTTISYRGATVLTQTNSLCGRDAKIGLFLKPEDSIDEIHFWSPENPNLYEVRLELMCGGEVVDSVDTYFAFRKISTEKNKILLNNIPLYQKLVLDQGYWDETDLTPPSAESLKEDILISKAMGFNGGRKHQKVEDPYYYYYADTLGFLVWGEMPSAYDYNNREIRLHTAQYEELILDLYNHPSVIVWVPLNESWGVRKLLMDRKQKDYARAMYYLTKSIDATRLVSTNDGWEGVEETDIISIHDYSPNTETWAEKYRTENLTEVFPMARRLMGFGEKISLDKPVILTEYGGIAVLHAGVKELHTESDGEAWGYCLEKSENFLQRFKDLNRGVFACDFAGYCYTQLTDVKQEVNGLLSKDHEPKFDVKKIAPLNDRETYEGK